MVWHQHVGVHGALVPARGGAQEFEIKMPLAIGVKTIRAIVSALDDVERHPGQV